MSDAPATRTTRRAAAKPAVAPEDFGTDRLALVAERAYQKFVARGFVHGHDLEDWTAAEAEIAAEHTPSRPKRARKA